MTSITTKTAGGSSRRIAGLIGPTLLAVSSTEAMNMGIFITQSAPVVYLNGTAHCGFMVGGHCGRHSLLASGLCP